MHNIAKTGISNLLTAGMKIPDDNLSGSKIKEDCPDPRDSAAEHKETGDPVKTEIEKMRMISWRKLKLNLQIEALTV